MKTFKHNIYVVSKSGIRVFHSMFVNPALATAKLEQLQLTNPKIKYIIRILPYTGYY